MCPTQGARRLNVHFCLSLGNLPKRKLMTAIALLPRPLEVPRKYNCISTGPGGSGVLYQMW